MVTTSFFVCPRATVGPLAGHRQGAAAESDQTPPIAALLADSELVTARADLCHRRSPSQQCSSEHLPLIGTLSKMISLNRHENGGCRMDRYRAAEERRRSEILRLQSTLFLRPQTCAAKHC